MFYNLQPPLDFDPTGINKDNLISNEPKKLSTKKNRAIVPDKGLFYGNSMLILDGVTPLVRGVQFRLEELHQDLTTITGREVYAGVVVTDPKVSQNVKITYQAVGGYYMNDNKAIANLWESFLTDKRPQDWNDIVNKPLEFPPSAHEHLLEDVRGWEPIIYQLERINKTLNLGQLDLMVSSTNKLLNRFGKKELPKIFSSDKVLQYDAFLYFMTRRKIASNLWVDSDKDTWEYGRMASFSIDTSEYEPGTMFRWRIFKQDDAKIQLPIQSSGIVYGNGGIVKVRLYVPSMHVHENETLYIGVYTGEWEGEFNAVSYKIEFDKAFFGNSLYGNLYRVNSRDGDDSSELGYYDVDVDSNYKYLDTYSSLVKRINQ